MDKRTHSLGTEETQSGNRRWWTNHTMSYDWNDKVALERFSPAWFDEIDTRFAHGARLFSTDKQLFDKLIPFEKLKGASVLEIGCGMGLHSELMVRAGARLTAIDLSPTSVTATKKRMALKGLEADIREGDAESLPFDAASFDFVWSWGVIHHSSRTARIVREISRVLRPGGEARVMVYNRDGMSARLSWLRHHMLRGGFLRRSFDETLYIDSDGFTARFYVREHFEDVFRGFFSHVDSFVCGQDADAVPLPGPLRRQVLNLVPNTVLQSLQAKWGSFLCVVASNPT